jgi:putative addiction module component (TIGR02574 family)
VSIPKEQALAMNAEFAPLFELSCAERLQLVEDLWDSIAKEADQIPVPDWQIEEVERIRLKAEQNPASLESWDSVRDWIVKNHG